MIGSLLLFACVLQALQAERTTAVDLRGLWRCEQITSGETPNPNPAFENRAFLIFDERILDVLQYGESIDAQCFPLRIVAQDEYEGKRFCLLNYPPSYGVKRGVLICKPNEENPDRLVVCFEIRNDDGSKHKSYYWLFRPEKKDGKLILEYLTKPAKIDAGINHLETSTLQENEIELIQEQIR